MLELDSIGFRYPGSDWVFRNVSLTVAEGSVTAVLGPNGRGKTTLLRCAAGLAKPQEGAVSSDCSVGFVPQTRGGAFAYRAIDMVVMGRVRHVSLFSAPTRDDEVAAMDAMDRIGVGHLAERQFPTLSGGEQQLVLIARAIASGAPMLVLDEPTTGLDLHNQVQILSLLRKLVTDGMGVLLTTHHPDHALYLADSVVLMGARHQVIGGPAASMLTDTALSDLYGIGVQTVAYDQDGEKLRAIITRYDNELGSSAVLL